MSYGKEIPEYAMMPAKEVSSLSLQQETKEKQEAKEANAFEETMIIPVTKGGVYSSIQLTDINEKAKTEIIIEEDILVPDTKPDMREILMIDGTAKLSTGEYTQAVKGEDYITLSGEIELSGLYLPERDERTDKSDMPSGSRNEAGCDKIISVQSRLPFKEQWHTLISPGATLTVECKIEKIDYMVINERKYRVKLTLAVFAKEYIDKNLEVFEGITDEEIQMRKETIQITRVELRKKDSLSISENLAVKEEGRIESILKQDICVLENYKQVAGEKVVINGFIFVNLLYTAIDSEETTGCEIKQASEKVEFTQFIPIKHGDEASGCSVSFNASDLRVKLARDEDSGEVLRLEGELLTYVEVYVNAEKEIITDAYHREKDFVCDFREEKSRTLVASTVCEASVREIISAENYGEIGRILYTSAEARKCESYTEAGKVVTEGVVSVRLICQSEETEVNPVSQIFSLQSQVPFRAASSMPQAVGGEIVKSCVCVKEFWAEKINGKQAEFNATLTVSSDIMRETSFKLPQNPAFEESTAKVDRPQMVIYKVRKDDSLWSIAKHFKTTTETICVINNIESGEAEEGTKLLILR